MSGPLRQALQDLIGQFRQAEQAAAYPFNASPSMRAAVEAAEAVLASPSVGQEPTDSQMLDAINWLMGCNGEFERPAYAVGNFWWRSKFASMAGLVYDGTRYVRMSVNTTKEAE